MDLACAIRHSRNRAIGCQFPHSGLHNAHSDHFGHCSTRRPAVDEGAVGLTPPAPAPRMGHPRHGGSAMQPWEYLQVNLGDYTAVGDEYAQPWVDSTGRVGFCAHSHVSLPVGRDKRGRQTQVRIDFYDYSSLLNQLGTVGWELISGAIGNTGASSLLFKRPKQEGDGGMRGEEGSDRCMPDSA